MKDLMASAKHWLRVLEEGTDQFHHVLELLREDLANGGLSLAELDTSEERIAELVIKGRIKLAEKLFARLRRSNKDQLHLIRGIRHQAQKGGFDLTVIGTKEEELISFELACMREKGTLVS